MSTPKRNTPDLSEVALVSDTERILRALEQGKRATRRPMPAPQRAIPDSSNSRPR